MKFDTKKFKTILPSLALILTTLAAGVTGTIAWFSANNTVTASGMSISVVNEDGDLSVAVYSGVGTTVSNNTVSVSSYGMLNSSYDYTNGYLYTIKAGKTSTDTDPYRFLSTQSEDNWRSGSYYYAVTFTYVFTYTFSTNTSDVGLFFDTSESTLSNSDSSTDTGTNTQMGFRMAFESGTFAVDSTDTTKGSFTKATSDPQDIVWAPRRSDPTECKFIHNSDTSNPATTTSLGVYYYDANTTYSNDTNTVLVYGTSSDGTNTNVYSSKAASSSDTKRRDYIGTFSGTGKSSGDTSTPIAVNVVCWYEGTDSSIVNSYLSTIKKLSASLHFYSVRLNSK